MDRKTLISSFIKFFKSKKHAQIPSASLVPSNDPTVLFTTAGMHPLVPYLLGEHHPSGKRLVNVQPCVRTQDIDLVGDETHHTLFEMLGNWSLGDYWKEESITYSFEFLTKVLGIPSEKLAVTIFKGEKDIPKDTESENIWSSLGIKKERIAALGNEDNWWGPAGTTGPCGPDTEIFYWSAKGPVPKKFDPNNKNWVEIWNNVFMEYEKEKRVILVDGMHCIYDEKFNLNSDLLSTINNFNTHTILVVNKFREKGENLVRNGNPNYDTNWRAFSQEERKIWKDNPNYFKKLLKEGGLVPEEIIYFDHDRKNVETAKKLGIIAEEYKGVASARKFIETNLYAYVKAKQRNVDTGMGVERTVAALNNVSDNYLTQSFAPVIKEIEKISGKKYTDETHKESMRVIADHVRAATFILAEEILPSNIEKGYVLRRLIRRAIRHGNALGIKENFLSKLAPIIIKVYLEYEHLENKKQTILRELEKEETKFNETLERGLAEFKKLIKSKKKLLGKDTFLLFQSYGFPIEMTEELAIENGITMSKKEFEEEYKKHQELSKSLSAGTFKSGLADNSEKTTRLHTATHMLNEALKRVLGSEVKQKGSNITPERLRFDFSFSRKLTEQELKDVEKLVNEKIEKHLEVVREQLPLKKALESGAQGEFGHKYPEIVSVYTIQDKKDAKGWFSKEICTGPHVKNTKEVGTFKITKEESASAGVRRIKAVVE